MNQETVTEEMLDTFLFHESDDELYRLLAEHPALAEYVVPLLALLQAINMLSLADELEIGEHDEHIVELAPTEKGSFEARWSPSGSRDIEQYVPLLLRVAQSSVNFLNEKGYRLLTILAADQRDPVLRSKLERFRNGLRLCLDRGQNDLWLAQRDAEREKERFPESAEETRWSVLARIEALFLADDRGTVRQLVEEEPATRVYAEGLPIDFSSEQVALRKAVAQFCWGGWAGSYRAVKTNPCLLTPPAWQLMERVGELAHAQDSIDSVHYLVASHMRDNIKLLKRCVAEGIEPTLLDIAERYVMGTV